MLLAFRHLPLEGKHTLAVKAAEAAECRAVRTDSGQCTTSCFAGHLHWTNKPHFKGAAYWPGCSGLSSLPGGRDG